MKLQLLKKKSFMIIISCLLISWSSYAQSIEQIEPMYVSSQQEGNQSKYSELSDYRLFNCIYNQLVQGQETIDLDYRDEKNVFFMDIIQVIYDIGSTIQPDQIIGAEYLYDEGIYILRTIDYEIHMHLDTDRYYVDLLEVKYIDKPSFMEKMQVLRDIIDPVIAKCNAVDTDIQKELIIHDFIVTHTAYDYENYLNDTVPSESYTTYGVLFNRTAVCGGYAKATKFLLNLVDIPCDVVEGESKSSGEGHAWNIVTIDGENYLVDTTWDDPVPDRPNTVRYSYFNVTDNILAYDHVWEDQGYPACTNDKYTFLNNGDYTVSEGTDNILVFNDTWYYLGGGVLSSYNIVTREKNFIAYASEGGIRLDEENLILFYKEWDSEEQEHMEKKFDLIPTEVRQALEECIERFYEECLGRQVEAEGKTYWIKQLIKGNLTGAQLAEEFIHSAEFSNKELTDTEYIEIMYKVFFDRAGDEDGLEFWRENLEQGLTRDYVLAEFVNSSEYGTLCFGYGINRGYIINNNVVDKNPNMTKFIYRLYQKCMNRKADAEGLEYWVNGLVQQSFTGRSVAEHFTSSEEFINADLSNEAFMEIVYEVFFDREADEEGMSYWLERLENEDSRSVVLEGFIDSAEYKQICKDYGIVY